MFRSLVDGARKVLVTKDPLTKIEMGTALISQWRDDRLIDWLPEDQLNTACDEPDMPDGVEILAPGKCPKRGPGSEKGRIALVHSLVHIEYVAINLAFDIIARFGPERHWDKHEFYSGFLLVAEDEMRHFQLLSAHLGEMGAAYGDLPGHSGIWDCAKDTGHSLMERLAVENMFHEARGLDITPRTVVKLRQAKATATADLLEQICSEEVSHVEIGLKFFKQLCVEQGIDGESQQIAKFHEILGKHIFGGMRPPFSHDLRAKAGMARNWYSSEGK